MAAPRRGEGGIARRSADATPTAAGRALRGRRLRQLLSNAAVARGGRRVADRAVRAAHRAGAARGDPQPLQVGRSRRPPILQESTDAGAAGWGARARAPDPAVPESRGAGPG